MKSLSHTCLVRNKSWMQSFMKSWIEITQSIKMVHYNFQPMSIVIVCFQLTIGHFWLWLYFYFGEFFQLLLPRTSSFASVTFMFMAISFPFLYFNRCHFHVIFTLACFTLNVIHILQVSFALFSYRHKFSPFVWEVSHINKCSYSLFQGITLVSMSPTYHVGTY